MALQSNSPTAIDLDMVKRNEQIKAAKRKVMDEIKPQDNYLKITLGFDNTVILPYDAGMLLISALKQAEGFDGEWGKEHIVPIKTDKIATHIMSHKEYVERKTAQLLGVPYSEIGLKHTNE